MSFIENMNHNIGDKLMKYKIGCRFQTGMGNIVEVIKLDEGVHFQVISINETPSGGHIYTAVNDIFRMDFIPMTYKYLGNFSKDSNFETLYNLFNS